MPSSPDGHHQALRRRHRARRRGLPRWRGRGRLPCRRERLGQVDAHQDPRGRRTGDRRHDPHRRGPIDRLNPRVAAAAGIKVIYQDFSLFPNLTVAENIASPRSCRKTAASSARADARTPSPLGADRDRRRHSRSMPASRTVGRPQAAYRHRPRAPSDARLIIMDEPTTALTEREMRALFAVIHQLQGTAWPSSSSATSSPRCWRSATVVVLRNGRKVVEGPASEFDAPRTRHMTGRDVPRRTRPRPISARRPLLRVEGLNSSGRCGISISSCVPARSWASPACSAQAAPSSPWRFSAWCRIDSGHLMVDGKPVRSGRSQDAIGLRIGYVPEDRLTEGLFLAQSIPATSPSASSTGRAARVPRPQGASGAKRMDG